MFEKVSIMWKKISISIMSVMKTAKEHRWSFEKMEGRIYQAIAAGLFFVCLCCGVCPKLEQERVLSEELQESVLPEGPQAIVEKKPVLQSMDPLGIEGALNAMVRPNDRTDGTLESQVEYIRFLKAYTGTESIGTRYVSGTCVNFRQAPNLESIVLNKLYRNTKVELLADDNNGFSVIRYNGQIGYMYSEYLSEEKIIVETAPQYDYGYDTSLRERVAAIARNNQGTQPCIGGYCAKWVSGVYQAAGLGYPGGNAIDYWTRWGAKGSTSMDNIPVGAVVVGSGSGSEMGNKYGHVGIYLGDGLVADNIGYHRIVSIWEWVAYNKGTCNGYRGYIGWVWPYGTEIPE